MDPQNHNIVVEFNNFSGADYQYFMGTPPAFNDIPNSFMEARYSTNGGATWFLISDLTTNGTILGQLGNNLPDPTATTLTNVTDFTNVSALSVAFDTQHNFYVTWTEHNAANTSGVVLLSKYNLSGSAPTVVFEDEQLYSWSSVDPAFNPTIAIDTNQSLFTDPTTGATQSDPLAGKAVYVAWNENLTEPLPLQTAPPEPPFESRIIVEGSANGINFSPPELVGAAPTAIDGNNFDSQFEATGAQPQIVFTQGTATLPGQTPRVPGGELVLVWNGSELETVNGVLEWVYDQIDVNISQPAANGQEPVGTDAYVYQQFSPGSSAFLPLNTGRVVTPASDQNNLNDAGTGAGSASFAATSNVAPGTPLSTGLGAQYGTFYYSLTNDVDQNHDLVTITGTSGDYTISTQEIVDGVNRSQTRPEEPM